MKALQVERSLARFAAARIASEWRAGAGGRFGPCAWSTWSHPRCPGPGGNAYCPA